VNPTTIFNFGQDLPATLAGASATNMVGLYYQPHYRFKVRELSPYTETFATNKIDNLPENARYFQSEKLWRWRDLYGMGYIDPDGYGTDYPYMNDIHYVHKDINFYLRNEQIYTNKKDGITAFDNTKSSESCAKSAPNAPVNITVNPTPSRTPTITPTPTRTPTVTPSVTVSVTPDVTSTPSVTPTVTPTITVTSSIAPTPTCSECEPPVTPSITPSITTTPSIAPTSTPTRTPTPTSTCARPGGLSETMFWYADAAHGNFSGSLMEACYALTGWTSMIPLGASGTPAQFASLSVGQTVYFEPTTSCTTFPDGYYIIVSGGTAAVLHMSGGVVAGYPEICPNITPTPTPSVTPTVTPSITATPTITPTPSSTPPLPRLAFNAQWGGGASSAIACGFTTIFTAYLESGYSVPAPGLYFYNVISGGSPIGGNYLQWQWVERGGTEYAIRVGSGSPTPGDAPTGEIIEVVICVDPSPTPTPTITPTVTPTISITPTITPSPSTVRLVFEVAPGPYSTDTLACAATSFAATGYLEVGYSIPTVGAMLYTTAGGSTGFGSGCPLYITLRSGSTKWACIVANGAGGGGEPCQNPVGLIRTVVECVDPSPTPTPTVTITPTITPTVTPSEVVPTPSITPTLTPTPTPSPDCVGDENPYTGATEACWSFEESSGTFFDSTVNNEDLTTVVGVTYQQPPKIGTYSALFGSDTSYAEAGSSFNMTDFSISAWIKLVGTTTNDRVIWSQYNTGAAGAGYAFLVTAAGNLKFVLYKPFSAGSATTTGTVDDGNWHHVTVTYDYSAGTFHQYIDGYDSGGPWAGGTNNFSTSNYRIGNNNNSASQGLRGYLDGVSVFSKILTRCEVRYLWNTGSGRSCP